MPLINIQGIGAGDWNDTIETSDDLNDMLLQHNSVAAEYVIPSKQLRLQQQIGKGAFGVLYKANYQGNQVICKWKATHKSP
jgi:hypothetical protein